MKKLVTDSASLRRRFFTPDSTVGKPAAPFPAAEYQQRAAALRQDMQARGIGLVQITAPDSMYYYHGFNARYYRGHGPTAEPPIGSTFIHYEDRRIVHFDYSMERAVLQDTSVADEFILLDPEQSLDGLVSAIVAELRTRGWLEATVGMEMSSHLPNPSVSNAFRTAFEGCGCAAVDVTRTLRSLRRRKSPAEIALIREAARICDVGQEAARQMIRPGVPCAAVEGEITRAMYVEGGEPAAIGNGVLCGASPHLHAWTTPRPMQAGDFATIDVKGVHQRYHVTSVQTYYIGRAAEELIGLQEAIEQSFHLFERVVKAGVPVSSVSEALEECYRETGIWGLYEWAGGFEYGIAYPPDAVGEFYWSLDKPTEDRFLEGDSLTFYAEFGLQLAATFLVTGEGAERLTGAGPGLQILA